MKRNAHSIRWIRRAALGVCALFMLPAHGLWAAPGAPVITQQPNDHVVLEGTPATFTVGAEGIAPISYQWYRNGQTLNGATSNSHTTANTTAADDNAGFTVVVSNDSGSATSRVAVLRVDPGVLIPTGTNLIHLSTHSWRYNQSGADPDATWQTPGYNDSAWQSGNALFGYENSTAYPDLFRTALTPPSSGGPITVYFRTHFEFNGEPALTELVVSNLIDDGVVYYLNGAYAGNLRVGEAPSQTASTTAANQGSEGQWELFTLPAANLVQGDNVLAVELHQGSTNSSDAVFGLGLFAWITNRVADTDQPVVERVLPVPQSRLPVLYQIEVLFTEPVTNVDAGDLLIDGVPAPLLDVFTESQYVFTFPEPPTGVVQVAWAPDHGITDLALGRNAFVGSGWTYNLDPNSAIPPLTINEFLASNRSGYANAIRDEDGDYSDWIEIYNAGNANANLEGWFLTDDPADLTKWRFPAIPLPGKKYLVVFASDKNRAQLTGRLHTNFQLDKEGGYLALVAPNTNVVTQFFPTYPPQTTGVSYGLVKGTTNTYGYFPIQTPASANDVAGAGFAPEVQFSRTSSTFVNGFTLELSTASSNAVIRYSIGQSLPTETSPVYTGPIQISGTVYVRARAYQNGLLPGSVRSEGYIQLDSAANVTAFNSSIPIVVLHDYGQGAPPSAEPRPDWFVMCQVFEPRNGSASITNQPDLAFAGVFHRRGSSTGGYDKGSFLVEARDEFGDDREVPFAGLPEESDWVFYAPNRFEPVLIHNPVAQDIYRQMGYYTPRTKMVELFLQDDSGGPNRVRYADYNGIYVLLEKIKVDKSRVDIPKLQPENTTSPAITGGYLVSIDRNDSGTSKFNAGSQDMNYLDPSYAEMVSSAYAPHRNYLVGYFNQFYSVLSGSSWRDPVHGYAAYINVTNWIDYHIQNVVTFNVDGLRLSAFLHKPRLDPENPGSGAINWGPQWDYDRTQGSTDGRDYNPRRWRSNYGSIGTDFFNSSSVFANPWYRRLFTDPDFWQLWIDRYQLWRRSVISNPNINALIDDWANSIRQEQPREQARWGTGSGNSNTRPRNGTITFDGYSHTFNGTYQGEVNFMKQWYADRFQFIDGQFLAAPTLNREGGPITQGTTVTLMGPSGAIVYYTLDGRDPRTPGGGFLPGVRSGTGVINIPVTGNMRVFARAYNANHNNQTGSGNPPLSSHWSGPAIATYVAATPQLAITEIMFEPRPAFVGDTNDANNFEFVELKNVGTSPINLTGFSFTNGIYFTFPNTLPVLQAGQYVVVVKNLAAFQARYPGVTSIAGEYTGNLANGGENLYLEGPMREPILDLAYDNAWDRLTRGNGFSLVVADENSPSGTWTNATSWRASSFEDGSPGGPDPAPLSILPVYINEVMAHPVPPAPDAIELFNPNATGVNIGGWYLSDDFGTPKKFRIPDGTILQPGAFHVFTEADFNANPALPTSFALGARGDDVYLFSAEASGRLTGYYHGFDFGDSPLGVTFGRYVTSVGEDKFVLQTTNTLGGFNAGPMVGPIAITEIMYHPPDYLVGTNWIDNADDEFVELYNLSDQAAPLYDPAHPTNTWQLRDAVQFTFPTNVSIPPNGYVLVVNFDPQTNAAMLASFRSLYGVAESLPIFGPYGGKLSNTRDSVELVRPGVPVVPADSAIAVVPEIRVDRVQYTNSTPWPCGSDGTGNSLQRLQPGQYGNDPGNWLADVPTPGVATIVRPAGLATIVQQPQSKVVAVGANVTFSVAQCGLPPFTFTWMFNGTEIPNANTAALTLNGVQLADAGDYVVQVGNGAGVVTSQPARLVVQLPPTIQVHPQSQTVLGYTMTSLTVLPGGTPPFSYQWKLNGANVAGGTNQTLLITNVTELSRGNYTVLVYNTAGSVLSTPATLTVNLPAKIVQQPFDIDTTNGYSVSWLALVNGDAPVSYQWYFNGQPKVGATSALLTLNNVSAADEGTYNLVVSNRFGVDVSHDARLRVLVMPYIVEHPESRIVTVGSDAALRVAVEGTQPMGYRWRRNSITIVPFEEGTDTLWLREVQLEDWGTYMVIVTNAARLTGVGSRSAYVTVVDPPGDRMVLQGSDVTLRSQAFGFGVLYYAWQFNGAPIPGATMPDLTLTNVSLANAGVYTLTVSHVNSFLSADFPVVLTVQESATPPEITLQPTNRTVLTNATVRLYAAATGTAPLSYQWCFNGTNLLEGATNASLALSNVQSTHSGDYWLVVQNMAGAATSQVAVLTVAEPLTIIAQPTSLAPIAGSDVTFTIGVSGTAPICYQWYFNHTNLIEGATNVSLVFDPIEESLSGAYHVVVSNVVGAVTSMVATLTVLTPPLIVQQPANVITEPGGAAIFEVVATGTLPLSYQWFFMGTNRLTSGIDGTFAITNAQASDLGDYTVAISNVAGVVTSAVAVLSFTQTDADQDGLPDDWEIAHGLNPDSAEDAALDSDQDGLLNWQEYQVGTNPTNAASVLRLEFPEFTGGAAEVLLRFQAISNRSYRLEYRDRIDASPWQEALGIEAAPSNRILEVTNALGPSLQRFYRIGTPNSR